jgi:hypothetical protein
MIKGWGNYEAVFENVGVARVDSNLRALKFEVEGKTFLIGLMDLENALNHGSQLPVFKIVPEAKKGINPDSAASQEGNEKASQLHEPQSKKITL